MVRHSKRGGAIEDAFSSARKEGHRALIGFLTAGYPSPRDTPRLCQALIDGGVDILELGIPFSDPIADGPIIQSADVGAIGANTTTQSCFEIARSVKNHNDIPIVFLTYYNPVFKMGLKRFLEKASYVADGLVVPDLPEVGSDEFRDYKKQAEKNGLSTVLLAAPTTDSKRLRTIMRETSGFLYLVSLLGVTGVRKNIDETNHSFISRACELSSGSPPVAVGFGISAPEHVRAILKTGADGVIVGSAFVNIVRNNLGDIEAASAGLKKLAHILRAAAYARKS